jgi:hypothetical protein
VHDLRAEAMLQFPLLECAGFQIVLPPTQLPVLVCSEF